MAKNFVSSKGLKVEKNTSTEEETTDGDRNIYSAVLKKDNDGIKVQVTIKITMPDGGINQRNPLDGLLIGQPYDINIVTDQQTLKMPKDKPAKKKK